MYAYEIPNLRFSLPAGGEVDRHRFVKVASDGTGVAATAGAAVVGASMNTANTSQVLEVADGIVTVVAGGTVAAGAQVSSDANGKAVATAEGAAVAGIAITGGSAGDIISVKIN